MIKVKGTKTHEPSLEFGKFKPVSVLVTEAKLVLVEVQPNQKVGSNWIVLNHKYFIPILTSENEDTETHNLVYNTVSKTIFKATEQLVKLINNPDIDLNTNHKVLALPESFSPKQLQMIVDGKLKDGDKVFIECEEMYMNSPDGTEEEEWTEAKLNSSNHIILHKVEGKMYTRKEVEVFCLESAKVFSSTWNKKHSRTGLKKM